MSVQQGAIGLARSRLFVGAVAAPLAAYALGTAPQAEAQDSQAPTAIELALIQQRCHVADASTADVDAQRCLDAQLLSLVIAVNRRARAHAITSSKISRPIPRRPWSGSTVICSRWAAASTTSTNAYPHTAPPVTATHARPSATYRASSSVSCAPSSATSCMPMSAQSLPEAISIACIDGMSAGAASRILT